jgi:hypothetical protein
MTFRVNRNKPSGADPSHNAGKPTKGAQKLKFPCAIGAANFKQFLCMGISVDGKFIFHTKKAVLGIHDSDQIEHRAVAETAISGSFAEIEIPDIIGGVYTIMHDKQKKTSEVTFSFTSTYFNRNRSFAELNKFLLEMAQKNAFKVVDKDMNQNLLFFQFKV